MVGDEDVGYGPARAFMSSEVRAIQAAVAATSDAEFTRRFSVEALAAAEIYPDVGHTTDEEERPYFLEYFQALQAFLAHTAQQNKGLLVYIN